ncbi:MAG: DUF4263 domain-containing protein [Candidatus Thorarchaeota archaeon]|nr:MAG: DUF4263 domain-containing protein [Candidatus Thorarchaeota archaeon]
MNSHKGDESIDLHELLVDAPEDFPVGDGIEVVGGRTLYKGGDWWKAVLLINAKYGQSEKPQLRFYAWKFKKGRFAMQQKFNMSMSSYVYDMIDILNAFADSSDIPRTRGKDYSQRITEMQRKIDTLEKRKSKIPEFKKRIKEFETILDNPKTNEHDLHSFLKKEAWMFGVPYSRMAKSEKEITIKSRNDFLLKRLDGYYDVLELKSPKSRLFVTKGSKKVLSKDSKDAISQVVGYLSDIRKHYLSIKEQTGMDIFFPKGIVVIGRSNESDRDPLKSHNEFFHNLEMWTYDDVLTSAKQTIEIYKRVKPRE